MHGSTLASPSRLPSIQFNRRAHLLDRVGFVDKPRLVMYDLGSELRLT
jgi:hypothetical protein